MRKINEARICVIHTSYIIHTIQSSDIIEHEKNAVLLLAYFVYNSTLKSAPHIESIKALRSVFKIFAFSDFSASLLWMRTQLLNSCGSLLLLCWTCCWLHQRKQININSSLREKYRKILNNSLFYKLKIAANEFICCFFTRWENRTLVPDMRANKTISSVTTTTTTVWIHLFKFKWNRSSQKATKKTLL